MNIKAALYLSLQSLLALSAPAHAEGLAGTEPPKQWTKTVQGLGNLSVVEKPKCVGDVSLRLAAPSQVTKDSTITLRVNDSKEGNHWVVSQDAMFHKLSLEALAAHHESAGEITCYKGRFPRVEVKNGVMKYDGKVVEERAGKIYLDGKLMPGQ